MWYLNAYGIQSHTFIYVLHVFRFSRLSSSKLLLVHRIETPQGDQDGICSLAAGVKAQNPLSNAGGGRKRKRALVRRPIGEGGIHESMGHSAQPLSIVLSRVSVLVPLAFERACCWLFPLTYDTEEVSGWTSDAFSVLSRTGFATTMVCTQMPEYRQVRTGMKCAVVVLSRSSAFNELTGVTEAYLPELGLFVGRFPALDKR